MSTTILQAINGDIPPEIKLKSRDPLMSGIPDGILAIIAPVIAYWSYSTVFHLVDVYELAEKYRIHPSEEEQMRNKVPLHRVVQDVIVQHIIQIIAASILYLFEPVPVTGDELYHMWTWKQFLPWLPASLIYYGYNYGVSIIKFLVAIFIVDTWQYWLHKTMHQHPKLYRWFHSRHHQLYVPYAYGALFNNPVEGFLLDTLGTGIAALVTGLSQREATFMYVFATMKTIDDHCGYAFPWDPFQIIFPNNSVYHDIHHQNWGIKSNFSQPFFIIWDKINGTEYHFIEEYKKTQKQITFKKYREFLDNKQKKKQ